MMIRALGQQQPAVGHGLQLALSEGNRECEDTSQKRFAVVHSSRELCTQCKSCDAASPMH